MWPCGKCHNCRINRKREWQSRLLLEAATAAFSSFVTLTIGFEDEKHHPVSTYLDKPTCQRFIKRLREVVRPVAIRYLLVGEYGERKGRAHYHMLLFSSSPISADVLANAWQQGAIHIGDVQQESIDYCLAYVLKGPNLNGKLGPDEVCRRTAHPEFRLHSQGLGRDSLLHLCTTDPETGELLLNREFRVLGRKWPVGRYLRDRHRGGTASGLHDEGISDPVKETDDNRIERLLYEELRTLPAGSPAYSALKEKIQARRDAQLKRLKGRRIHDYYKDLHHHNDRGRKNETF